MISVPGGGKSLQTLSSKKGGGGAAKQTNMPGLGKKKKEQFLISRKILKVEAEKICQFGQFFSKYFSNSIEFSKFT